VAAIMLNHKQPHEEARGRHRKQQSDPPIFKMDSLPRPASKAPQVARP
jgi:hypothetical protein